MFKRYPKICLTLTSKASIRFHQTFFWKSRSEWKLNSTSGAENLIILPSSWDKKQINLNWNRGTLLLAYRSLKNYKRNFHTFYSSFSTYFNINFRSLFCVFVPGLYRKTIWNKYLFKPQFTKSLRGYILVRKIIIQLTWFSFSFWALFSSWYSFILASNAIVSIHYFMVLP